MPSHPRSVACRPAYPMLLKPLVLAITAAIVISSVGCSFGEFHFSDPFDREYSLGEAQHRYTTLVRFGDFKRASDFVNPDDRAFFMKSMKNLDEARFTEYETGTVELDDERARATIIVTYTIYTPSIPFEFEVSETQVWTRDGISNNWQVFSTFEGLHNLAAN